VLALSRDAKPDDLLAAARRAARGPGFTVRRGRLHGDEEPLGVRGQQVPLVGNEWIQVGRWQRSVETGHVLVDRGIPDESAVGQLGGPGRPVCEGHATRPPAPDRPPP